MKEDIIIQRGTNMPERSITKKDIITKEDTTMQDILTTMSDIATVMNDIQNQMGTMQTRMDKVETRIEKLETGMNKMHTELKEDIRRIDRKFDLALKELYASRSKAALS